MARTPFCYFVTKPFTRGLRERTFNTTRAGCQNTEGWGGRRSMFRALGLSSHGERLEHHYVLPPASRMHGGSSPGRQRTHASINMDQSTKPHQAARSQCVDIKFIALRFISRDDQTPHRVAPGVESIAFPALPYLTHARTLSLTHTRTHSAFTLPPPPLLLQPGAEASVTSNGAKRFASWVRSGEV